MKLSSPENFRTAPDPIALEASAFDSEMAFGTMEETFAQVRKAHPGRIHELRIRLADQLVAMRIVGDGLAGAMSLAFAHLQVHGEEIASPRLLIELWDQAETGISRHIGSTRADLYLHPLFTSSRDHRYVTYQLQYSMTGLDRQAGHLIGSITSIAELSLYEQARPLRVPLSIWQNDRDVPVIHAGLVSKNGQGVLFPGASGSGKTTSALTCLCAGFDFLSDDLVGLQVLLDGSCQGHSFHNSTFVEPAHLNHFPSLKPHGVKSRYAYEDKLLIHPSMAFPERIRRVTRINAIALPCITGQDRSTVRQASKGEALLVAAPHSLFKVPFSPGLRGFHRLAQLVERVPCYWLELGRDLTEIPKRVDQILEPS